jgi:D-serine deaminase-like pyridoxal phosphate-dependent protein
VCLDIDMSSDYLGLHFGVRRSPVTTVEGALSLSRRVLERPHLRLDGIMGYEAQIAGLPDVLPGRPVRSAVLRLLKGRSVTAVARRRAATVAALREQGISLRFVNGGGTGSLETTAAEDVVTEVTAGSGFYSPALFDGYRSFKHLPAAGFAVEITRKPTAHVWTCHGGGFVASGAPGRDKLPLPYLPHGAILTSDEGAGEVQTPVAYRGPESLNLGDPVFMRHAKAGELCEHFDTLLLVSGGKIVDEARTYRGEGCRFL